MKRKHIYVFTTPTYREKSLFKIGETTKEVTVRVNQWAGGSPEDLEIEIAFSVPEHVSDKDVHAALVELGAYRPKPRHEWFETNLEQITTILRNLTNNDLVIYAKNNPEFAHLRPYQVEIDIAVDDFLSGPEKKGQVWSPTGSGKTESFINTIRKKLGHGLRIAIVHPRLKLSRDQLGRFQRAFNEHNVYYIGFHSDQNCGAHKTTTSQEDVQIAFDAKMNQDRDIIVFSSYDSLGNLDAVKFDLVIFDEAHNATSRYDSVRVINADKMIFYTATPIIDYDEELASYQIDLLDPPEVQSDNRGMNNVERFGNVIYQVTPRRLIREGFIVPPSVHQLDLEIALNEESGKYENADAAEICAIAFNEQYTDSVTKDGMPFCQMLVALSCTDDVRYIRNNLDKLYAKLSDKLNGPVTIFSTVSADSEKGDLTDAYINNEPMDEKDVSFADQVSNHEGNAIILHYKQIGEGIDISTITGFMSLRNLRPSEYIQMMGRAGRIYEGDKIKNELDQVIGLKDQKERLKTRCIVSIPTVQGKPVVIKNGEGEESTKSVETLVDAFVNFGYDDMLTYMSKEGDLASITGGHNRDTPENQEERLYSPIIRARIRRLVIALEQDYFSSEARNIFKEMSAEDQRDQLIEFHKIISEQPEIVNKLLKEHRDNHGKKLNLNKTHFVENQPYLQEKTVREMLGKIEINGEQDYLIYYCLEHAQELIQKLLEKGANSSRIDLKTTKYCETTEKWCALLGINYLYEE